VHACTKTWAWPVPWFRLDNITESAQSSEITHRNPLSFDLNDHPGSRVDQA